MPAPRLERRPERREVDFAEGPLRDEGRVVLAPGLGGAVGDPMLGAGDDAIRGEVILTLEPMHTSPRHRRSQVGILAGSLGDPPPARVAGNVHHRRKGPAHPGGRCLRRRDPRGTLHRGGVPATRLAQRDREDRAIAVDHVEAEQDRDLRGRLLDGDALYGVYVAGAAHVQE